MWRETKILLIDDDSARRRDLAVVLNFLEGLLDHALLTRLAEKGKAAADRIMATIARNQLDFARDAESYHRARQALLEALTR